MGVDPGVVCPVIRLAFCIDNFQIGGTELNAVRWAEHLSHERFHLTVVHFQADGPLRARFERAATQLVRVPLRNMYGPGAIRQGIRLARFLARARLDVFHAHDLYSNIFGVPWASLAGVPLVVALVEPESEHRPGACDRESLGLPRRPPRARKQPQRCGAADGKGGNPSP